MRLHEIQDLFKESVFEPNRLENEDMSALFASGGIALENRMRVYRNNVIRSLSEALITSFPMTEKLVGESFMKQAAGHYIAENLPAEGHLSGYGHSFPDFLAGYEPAANLPYLADVARLEWAWEESCHAADDKPMDVQILEKLPQEKLPALIFDLRTSVRLVASKYPLHRIVDFCTGDQAGDETLCVDGEESLLMVFRPALQVILRKLSSAEFRFLRGVQNGDKLEALSQVTLEADPGFDLGMLLEKFFKMGIFSGCRFAN